MEIDHLSSFLWILAGVLAGFLLVGLYNSFVGNNIPAFKAV